MADVEATQGAVGAAAELGIDLAEVPRSGPKVTKGDVLSWAKARDKRPTERAYRATAKADKALVNLPTDATLLGMMPQSAEPPNIGSRVLIRPGGTVIGTVIGATLSDATCHECTSRATRELNLSDDKRQVDLVTRCSNPKCPGRPLVEHLVDEAGEPDLKTVAEILAADPKVRFLLWTPAGGARNTVTLPRERLVVLP